MHTIIFQGHNQLLSTLTKKNLTIVTTESFSGNQSTNLDKIIFEDGRIIVGLFNETNARQVMCKVL